MITTRYINVPVAVATADVVDPNRNIQGRVVGVYVKFTGQPGTTVTTIKTQGGTSPRPPSLTILTLTSVNTSAWYRPLIAQQTTAGAAATYDGTRPVLSEIAVDDYLEVTVASGGAGSVEVWVQLETDSG